MKPCKACPFREDAPRGLWSPAHYLVIAYLGSVRDAPLQMEKITSMGCHEWNGVIDPGKKPEDTPICGGWLRAASDSISLRMKLAYDASLQKEAADGEPVMSPERMAEANGLDMSRLPPLEFDHKAGISYLEWSQQVMGLISECAADPEAARKYVVPGSPLDVGVEFADIVRVFGFDGARRLHHAREKPDG